LVNQEIYMLLQNIPTTGLKTFVDELARRHGVRYDRTGTRALAQTITRLADEEVVLDETEQLLIALHKARVIDGAAMRVILSRYVTEALNV
jgi:hypothetical protein